MASESQHAPAGLPGTAPSPNGQRSRTPAQIEADIEATRLRLQGTVDAIADRVSPKNVARRALESVTAQFVEPDGSLRTSRVAAAGAGLAAVVGLLVWRARH